MLNRNQETAQEVKDVMSNIYTRIGIEFKTYVTKLNTTGISIINQEA
jgi:homoserine kinase